MSAEVFLYAPTGLCFFSFWDDSFTISPRLFALSLSLSLACFCLYEYGCIQK